MTSPFKSIIVGTAGHIDHGKTSLVEALTGTNPDRLEEEKRRGITIDLGFAFLQENGVRFGFVDVPGHERFVANMLAGAAGIDLVVLVVAADESIKPQTREHFEICRLLGVSRGVVALTKSDLVDNDTLDLTRLELEDFLRGSFLEHAPIVPVSAKTRAGLDEFKSALVRQAQQVSGKDAHRLFRLPIDRAFAVKGFGTVVTGTLLSGSVGPGDEIELFPQSEKLRVRGVQSGGQAIERAQAGQRTAVNLAGIDHTAVKRGQVLAAPNRFRATRRFDARIHLLASAPRLKQRARLHLHSGASETVADVFLYDGLAQLDPGESSLAQFRLQDSILVLPGDRFILRQFSPVITIGGGVVLDPLARRPRQKDTVRTAWLEALERGNKEDILAAMTERSLFGLGRAEIAARTGWLDSEIAAAANSVVAEKRVRQVVAEPLLLVSAKHYDDSSAKILAKVAEFHKANPLSPGIPREDVRAALGRRVRPETFRAALEDLVAQKKLVTQGELVKVAGVEISLAPDEQKAKDQIESAFATSGLTVPSFKEVLATLPVEAKRAEKLLQILLREKNLVRVSPELIFHRDALAHLKLRLAAHKKSKGDRITVPVFKELTGVSRKYAIPLLEFLDRERVTRRLGDERVIL